VPEGWFLKFEFRARLTCLPALGTPLYTLFPYFYIFFFFFVFFSEFEKNEKKEEIMGEREEGV